MLGAEVTRLKGGGSFLGEGLGEYLRTVGGPGVRPLG